MVKKIPGCLQEYRAAAIGNYYTDRTGNAAGDHRSLSAGGHH